jgi:hypothetical protein
MESYRSPKRKKWKMNVPKDALSSSRYRGDILSYVKMIRAKNTDVSHGSIKVNMYRNTSIAETFPHESTMLPFHYDEFHEQCCDFSTNLGERATCECFAAIHHL